MTFDQVQLSDCPPPGAGVHSWILAKANHCRNSGLPPSETERLITEFMTRQPSPANEVRTAVAKAFREDWRSVHRVPVSTRRPPVPLTEIKFDADKLARVAERITKPGNWRHWLWERSPKRPNAMNAYSFLAHLYQPGETILIFDEMETKHPLQKVIVSAPMDCRVPELICTGGKHGTGIWFLCNPVDGQWHPNPRQKNEPSCRSEESVTSFRYAVLESDQAPANLWLGFVAQLPVRIAAIYTSGSRSVHCLIRLDSANKAEWDAVVGPLKRPLKVLGADPACLSAVRLSRLSQCWRPEKKGFQKLLYLCPNPPLAPLTDLPVIESRPWALARWRRDCPRWNQNMEAFA